MQLLIISMILLWLVVLVNLFLTLALIRRVNKSRSLGEPIETLPVGELAPDFFAETMGNERVTLGDYAGRTLAMVFISPTCGHCRPIIPQVEALGPKAKRSGVELTFVCDAEIDQTQAYIQELNITLPVLSAPRQSNHFLEYYKVNGVPAYVLINTQGKVEAFGHPEDLEWKRVSDKW